LYYKTEITAMKNSVTIALLLLVFAGCHAQNPQAEVDKVIAEMIKPESAGVTVAVAREGDVLYSKGYGLANVEYNIPNSVKTIFHVASVSKQFTAFAIALLADQKKISLDDDIRKYLPELHDFGTKVTIRHLVHHTSGLRDQWNLLALAGWRLDDVITKNQVLRLISHQDELNFKPGDEFSYCNTGYTLMGEIVSRVTGKSFADWCGENIFKPLGMEHTLFYDDHEKIVKDRAYSYNDSPQGLKKSVLSYANAGATSLFTTAEDLTKWSDNFYRMKVGNKAVMKQMEERGILNKGDTISYAFGQDISKYKGIKTVGHSGGDAGYRTFLLRFPEQRYSIVVLSNLGSFNPASLAYKIADIYLEKYLSDEPKPSEEKSTASSSAGAVTVKESVLTLYEGQYQLNSEMIVAVKLDAGKLTAQATGQPMIPLTATSETEFVVEGHGIKIAFKPSDKPAGEFTLYQGGQTIVAPRIKPFDPKSIDIKSYIGVYYSPELQTSYNIALTNDTLIVNHIRHEPVPMAAFAKDAFTTSAWFMSRIEFNRNAQSEVTGFKASSGRVKNVRFVKTTISPSFGN
jgi:CubicO group peptidase (beta-lactamase class C family)